MSSRGWKSAEQLRKEIEMFRLPDLRGKTVLDINAWDGFFSFEAERRGARRVVALDKMMWGLDLGGWTTYWQECKASNTSPLPFQDTPYWHPDTLPGKAGFDTAHSALSSRAESMVADFVEMDISSLGRFDVVLYLGSLYHMMDPLGAMRRVSAVTREHWVQSSSSFVVPRFRHVRHSLAIAPLSAVRGSHLPCGLA